MYLFYIAHRILWGTGLMGFNCSGYHFQHSSASTNLLTPVRSLRILYGFCLAACRYLLKLLTRLVWS